MKCDELKAFDVGLGRYTEDGSPCVVAFDTDQNPRILNEKVYLKSEADKVLAEKDEKIAELKEHNENFRFDNKNMLHKITKQDAELRLQKYKRCLANAKLAVKDDYLPWNMKWHKRWLELAEVFK